MDKIFFFASTRNFSMNKFYENNSKPDFAMFQQQMTETESEAVAQVTVQSSVNPLQVNPATVVSGLTVPGGVLSPGAAVSTPGAPPTTAVATLAVAAAAAAGAIPDPNKGQPKRLHVSNIPFRFRDPDLRAMFGVSNCFYITRSLPQIFLTKL